MQFALLISVLVVAESSGAAALSDSVYTCPAPAAEIARARQYLESRLGPARAAACIVECSEPIVRIENDKCVGIVGWTLAVRAFPQLHSDIECSFDLESVSGEPYHPYFSDLPDCAHFPELCDLVVTRKQAVALARDHGLVPKAGDYKVSLVVADKIGEFAWRVSANPETTGFDRVLLIDARSGEVESDFEDKPCK